jgi:hypothetical protein
MALTSVVCGSAVKIRLAISELIFRQMHHPSMISPSKARLTISEAIFSSDDTKNAVNTLCIREAFCEM